MGAWLTVCLPALANSLLRSGARHALNPTTGCALQPQDEPLLGIPAHRQLPVWRLVRCGEGAQASACRPLLPSMPCVPKPACRAKLRRLLLMVRIQQPHLPRNTHDACRASTKAACAHMQQSTATTCQTGRWCTMCTACAATSRPAVGIRHTKTCPRRRVPRSKSPLQYCGRALYTRRLCNL